jgi:hypothetical protein
MLAATLLGHGDAMIAGLGDVGLRPGLVPAEVLK